MKIPGVSVGWLEEYSLQVFTASGQLHTTSCPALVVDLGRSRVDLVDLGKGSLLHG